MKKSEPRGFSLRKRFLRIMKIYIVLACISLAKLFASETYGQAITLNLEDVQLKDILAKIEKDSDYHFFYNNSLVDVSKKTSIHAQEQEIQNVLKLLLSKTYIDYKIFKNQIVLFPKNDTSVLKILEEIESQELQNSKDRSLNAINKGLTSMIRKATQDPIRGTVSDGDGFPLPGASIVVKGTSRGTQTDFDGNYQIIADTGEVLVFSYVGMTTREVTVGNNKVVNVSLTSSASELEEVIVVAYGTAKKSDFTGSATQINAEAIEDRPISNVAQALQGASAGVNVSVVSGQPGAAPNIRVRGIGSINASSDPLYVLDGVPLQELALSNLNPNDIESITVLKDAASTSLYGSRAANGVVLITTKKGKKGKEIITLNISQGITSRSIPEYDRVDARQYYPLMWEAYRNSLSISGTTPVDVANQTATDDIFGLLGYNPFNVPNDEIVLTNGQLNPNARLLYAGDLDWQSPILRAGTRSNIDFSYQGASETTDYFVSLGYLNEEGYVINSDFKRITGRVNINSQLKEWFKAGVILSGTTSKANQGNDSGSNSLVNPFRTTRYIAPIYPVYLHDPVTGAFILDENGNRIFDEGSERVGSTSGRHVIQETLLNIDKDEITFLSARTYGEVTFLKDFKFTFNASLDQRFFINEDYGNRIIGDAEPLGSSSRFHTRRTVINYNQLLNYNRDFGSHTVGVLLGHESYDEELNVLNGSRNGQIFDGNTELANFVTVTDLNGFTDRLTIEGYLSRVNYDYNDTYYLSGSYRRDASSRFVNERWGDFFSVGGAWRIDQEGFVQNWDWLSALKFRASYGETGNQDLGSEYISRGLVGVGPDFNNASEAGSIGISNENLDLTWENNVQKDIALEFGLFDNRINGTVEYYNRKSKDLLFEVPVPVSSGLDDRPDNIGDMVNSGLEVDLSIDLIRNENVRWNFSVNASTLKNEITRLPQEEIITGTKKLVVGGDIFAYWLRDWYGVDPADGAGLYILDPDEADGGTDERVINGTNVTTNQNKALRDFVGTATPDLFGAFSSTVDYKGFSFGFTFTYQIGGETYDTNYATLMSSGTYGQALSTDILRRWQQPGDITDVPRLDVNQTAQFGAASDRWLTSSTNLALRQVNLGYAFNNNVLDALGLGTARLYVTGENLFLLSKRRGMDVGQNFNGTTSNRFTPARIITFGLNLTF
ncbi:TonB-dependent receptor [Sungkyunkwania multivorans]|uniref:TonB-dependent receptor n=1 Tax=Sungkyunkwania multivorans TaxID=1173618 RepID=A0ABW3CTJ1_9FLAO